MAIYLRLVCAVLVVMLVSSCVQSAEVDVGRKLSEGSGEAQELMYKKDGHQHKGMDGGKKDGHGSGGMGGWKKGYGKGGNDKGDYHGKGGHGKGYPGHPH
ncbi:hypothetical protein KP509_30G010400 [Ceratopteris richardii]|uniref:Glycine-rich protein n=2 Tax=Ceratopteris richardii TaxID=49495 RepID=A0A8T2R1Z7_CERRI|nr:hypothetical protein KP509_30G010400 [Ceratopteris richardii]